MDRSGTAQRGFTLVELLVVVMIVAVLTAIAVPSYRDSVMRSRRADGRVALHQAAQFLQRCYTQFGAYDSEDCEFAEPIASPEGFYEVTVDPLTASTYTLTATAIGAQADDAACPTLTLDHTGARGPEDAVDTCW